MKQLTNTTYSNTKAPELTLESLEKIVHEMKEANTEPAYKLVMLCKKHYKAIMKELKVKEANNSIFPGFVGMNFGEPFYFEIKPYLKKIRIIDIPPFNANLLSLQSEQPEMHFNRKMMI